MRVLSPENWYQRLEKQVAIFQAHTEIKEFSFIARSCRLKPYDVVFNKAKFGLQLYKHWIDEYGNQIVIGRNGKLKIDYNSLYSERSKIVNTDIYYNLSLDKIVKISKLAYIFCGIEDVHNTSCIYICLLGLDNCLRCYVYLYEEWQQVSPLYIGLYNLKFLANHLDIKYFINIKGNNINLPAHCMIGNGWITSLPIPELAYKEILLNSGNILNNIF